VGGVVPADRAPERRRKVLHWGISINDHAPETALRILADPSSKRAGDLQHHDRSPEKALFALARQKPLGIIVRVPFDEGALTGQIKANTVFPAVIGARSISPAIASRSGAAREGAGPGADDLVETLPELALRFVLSSAEVSTVIPGMRRPAHVRQNAMVSTKGGLPAGMLSKLKPTRGQELVFGGLNPRLL